MKALTSARHAPLILAALVVAQLLTAVVGASVVDDSDGTKSVRSTARTGSGKGSVLGGLAGVEAAPTTTAVPGGPAAPGAARAAAGRPSAAGGSGVPGAPGAVKGSGAPIKVGVLLLDIGNVSELGFPSAVSVEDQRAAWEHSTKKLNAAGGINGHPIEPVYKVYDPLTESSMREACLYVTEDKKVFFAVAPGGFVGAPILCITDEHKTPFLVAGSSGVPQDFYTRSKGLLFTTFMGSDRMILNFVDQAEQYGALRGKTIGVLHDLRSGPATIAEQMKKTLEARGHKVGRVSVFSADYATAASQVPIEVQQQRTSQVDVILNMSHALVFSQFTQEATSQGWTPPYFNSDWNGANSDFYYSNMPSSYDGNVNFTIQRANEYRASLPEPAVDRRCADEAGEATNQKIGRDHADYGAFVRQCAFFILMRESLATAGPDPTKEALTAAFQRLARLDLPNFGGIQFGPGRFDGGDHVRTMKWENDCKCIIPVSGFRPTRY